MSVNKKSAAPARNYPDLHDHIAALDKAGRLRLYIDLHNPGAGDKQPFFFGPFDYAEMTGAPRANYERWAQGIPGAKRASFPSAAHLVPIDMPAEFNRAVLDFLEERPD